jgi:hypothetical protein
VKERYRKIEGSGAHVTSFKRKFSLTAEKASRVQTIRRKKTQGNIKPAE